MDKHAHRRLGFTTFLWLALAGCSAHARFSVGAGSARTHEHISTGAPAAEPSAPAAQQSVPAAEQSMVAAEPAAGNPRPHPIPVAPSAPPAVADHDRGHGNDADGVDEQNPGKARRAKQTGHDHDRGHGNDADGIDEQNPGKSKRK